MPGPNVLDLVGDIRESVERLPREALVDILVYVFKEYVVEGPAPLATGTVPVADDLSGMSFGEVIRSLQLRLDLPELELFTVEDHGRVLVRLGGRSVPVETEPARPAPLPVPPPAVAAPPPPVAPVASTVVAPQPTSTGAAPPATTPASAAPPAATTSPTETRAPPPSAAPAAKPAEPPRTGGLLEID